MGGSQGQILLLYLPRSKNKIKLKKIHFFNKKNKNKITGLDRIPSCKQRIDSLMNLEANLH
jgi:hypothetical protein